MNKPIPKPQIVSLESLVHQYVMAKAELTVAKHELEQAEEALLSQLDTKEEGSTTIKIGNYKVTTTGKITRSLDGAAWDEIRKHIPEPLANRLVRYKPDINLRELKFVQANEPAYYAMIAPAITSRLAKTSLEVKEIV